MFSELYSFTCIVILSIDMHALKSSASISGLVE